MSNYTDFFPAGGGSGSGGGSALSEVEIFTTSGVWTIPQSVQDEIAAEGHAEVGIFMVGGGNASHSGEIVNEVYLLTVGDYDGESVTTSATGSVGATTLSVAALSRSVVGGTFVNGASTHTVSAGANAATSITFAPSLTATIASGSSVIINSITTNPEITVFVGGAGADSGITEDLTGSPINTQNFNFGTNGWSGQYSSSLSMQTYTGNYPNLSWSGAVQMGPNNRPMVKGGTSISVPTSWYASVASSGSYGYNMYNEAALYVTWGGSGTLNTDYTLSSHTITFINDCEFGSGQSGGLYTNAFNTTGNRSYNIYNNTSSGAPGSLQGYSGECGINYKGGVQMGFYYKSNGSFYAPVGGFTNNFTVSFIAATTPVKKARAGSYATPSEFLNLSTSTEGYFGGFSRFDGISPNSGSGGGTPQGGQVRIYYS
jgi:hypothetical protein